MSQDPKGYICGMAQLKSPNYLKHVTALKVQIDHGNVTTKAAAKQYLEDQLQEDLRQLEKMHRAEINLIDSS